MNANTSKQAIAALQMDDAHMIQALTNAIERGAAEANGRPLDQADRDQAASYAEDIFAAYGPATQAQSETAK